MTDMEEERRRNLENDWGPAAIHSDYMKGDTLRYRDRFTDQVYEGTIIWVAGPRESRIEGHGMLPTRYIVTRDNWDPSSFPDVVYSQDILSQELDAPELVKCKWCSGHHYRGQEQYCDRNPNKP